MMAALPYMQLYVADYLADTSHLTAEEHGAYLLLLFSYWQTGKPLRIDRLSTVARIPNDRWASVEDTLSEFFHVTPTHWIQFRVESDLEAVNSKVVTASNAGKASAKAKALKKQQELNDCSTSVDDPLQPNVNHIDTDTDTEQDQHNSLNASDEVPVPAAAKAEVDEGLYEQDEQDPDETPDEPTPEPVNPKAPCEMTLDWEPDAKLLKNYALRMTLPVSIFTPETTASFVCHYTATGRMETQDVWVSLLVKWVKGDQNKASNVRAFPAKSDPQSRHLLTATRDYKAGTKENANGTFRI